MPNVSIDFTLPDLIDVLASGPFPVEPGQIDTLRDRLDAKDAGAVAALAPAYLPLIEAAGPFESAHDRLCAFDAGGALTSRLDGLWQIAEGLKGRVALTLDPTERHGFEYQSWLGFSIFAGGVLGEIGRGGSYTIVHENGAEEAAVGFSLYADAIVAAGPGRGRSAPAVRSARYRFCNRSGNARGRLGHGRGARSWGYARGAGLHPRARRRWTARAVSATPAARRD
ncbi:ATP phosphoribosyltransferase regulatory subunit HisZ [Sphingomonas sp. UYP23]